MVEGSGLSRLGRWTRQPIVQSVIKCSRRRLDPVRPAADQRPSRGPGSGGIRRRAKPHRRLVTPPTNRRWMGSTGGSPDCLSAEGAPRWAVGRCMSALTRGSTGCDAGCSWTRLPDETGSCDGKMSSRCTCWERSPAAPSSVRPIVSALAIRPEGELDEGSTARRWTDRCELPCPPRSAVVRVARWRRRRLWEPGECHGASAPRWTPRFRVAGSPGRCVAGLPGRRAGDAQNAATVMCTTRKPLSG
jgi:hypothetical protein